MKYYRTHFNPSSCLLKEEREILHKAMSNLIILRVAQRGDHIEPSSKINLISKIRLKQPGSCNLMKKKLGI